jgi:succinate dehydrogenase / fumarate reductase cytochrome b subunit
MQSPEAYQWVPDTLEQVPYIWAIEIMFILVPIAFHGILGLFIIYWGDINAQRPALGWYENWAYVLQRVTGFLLFFLIIIHIWQTYLVKMDLKLHGQHFDIFGTMQRLFTNPAWVWVYFARADRRFPFRQRHLQLPVQVGLPPASWPATIVAGLAVALVGVVLGIRRSGPGLERSRGGGPGNEHTRFSAASPGAAPAHTGRALSTSPCVED